MKSLQSIDKGSSQSSWGPVARPADRDETPVGSAPFMPVFGPQRLGDELKSLYGGLTTAPLPDRMAELADALEEAFRRGELFDRRRHS